MYIDDIARSRPLIGTPYTFFQIKIHCANETVQECAEGRTTIYSPSHLEILKNRVTLKHKRNVKFC